MKSKSPTTRFYLKLKVFKPHETFLREFASLTQDSDSVRAEVDSEIFNSLILIATIVLSDNAKADYEKTLQNYIEVFFNKIDIQNRSEIKIDKEKLKQVAEDEEEFDDASSQYSTLSSLLGIQV